jgi:hypothetical protein
METSVSGYPGFRVGHCPSTTHRQSCHEGSRWLLRHAVLGSAPSVGLITLTADFYALSFGRYTLVDLQRAFSPKPASSTMLQTALGRKKDHIRAPTQVRGQ